MFETIIKNLNYAINSKNKSVYDIVLNQYKTDGHTFTEEEKTAFISLTKKFKDVDFKEGKQAETVKECLLDDPNCETCSS